MYIKYFTLIATLFVCGSCSVITGPRCPPHLYNLHVFINLYNIPSSVVNYKTYRITYNDATLVQHDKIVPRDATVHMKDLIKDDDKYSIELLKADGTVCISRDIRPLIEYDDPDGDDEEVRMIRNFKCLYTKKQSRKAYIDCKNVCDKIVNMDILITKSEDVKYLVMKESNGKTIYFNEHDTLELTCQQNEVPPNSRLTSHQTFGDHIDFYVSEKLMTDTKLGLNITLRNFDDGSTLYCTGLDNGISTKIKLELNETRTDRKDIQKLYINDKKQLTHICSEGEELLRQNVKGKVMFYGIKSVEIDKSDNGSIFLCMGYTKNGYNNDSLIFHTERQINNEVMYIYEATKKEMHDSYNLGLKTSAALILSISVVIVCLILTSMQLRSKRTNSTKSFRRPLPPVPEQQELDSFASDSCPEEHVYEEIRFNVPRTPERKQLRYVRGMRLDRRRGILHVNGMQIDVRNLLDETE